MMSSTPTSEILWRSAEDRRAQRDWPGAIADYSAFLAMSPAHVSARLHLSDCYLVSGQYRAALAILLQMLVEPPDRVDHLYALFVRLRHLGLAKEMVDCAAHPALLESQHPGHLADVGTTLSLHGRMQLARAYLDRAIAAVGEDGPLVYSRARINEFSGDYGAAERDLRKVLQQRPADAFAHWSLSRLPERHRRTDDLALLEHAVERVEARTRDEAILNYALFNHLDRLGDVGRAWRSLDRACRQMRSQYRYDASASRRLFAGLAQWPALPQTVAGATETLPIFIVGMHRTGTTLMETLLGAHPQIANAGETYDFPLQLRWACDRHFPGASDECVVALADRLDYAAIGQRYLKRLRWRAEGKRFVTDKLPMNYQNIGAILSALPSARIVHMVRNPMDTCFSNLKEGFAGTAAYSYEQGELADFFIEYRRLIRHWHGKFPGKILDVRYEDLVTRPEETRAHVLAFCGLPQIDLAEAARIAGSITTASSAQVRGDITSKGIGAWARYAEFLQPLQMRLQTAGEYLG